MVEAGDEFTRRQVEHYALYDAMCQREGVVDFAELLLRSYELLAGNDALREHYQRRFSHLLVDEFQDTNTLQYKWLRLLAGPDAAVFAVGDDDQSIYAFRGAKVANMQQFERDFATRGAAGDADQARAELPLARPHPRRRQCADPPQPGAARQEPVDERRRGRAGARVRGAFRPRRGGVHRRRRQGARRATACALDEVALLYRSNAQSRVLEHALFGAGLPYRVYGGMRFFERAEVKHALAYLRLIAAPDDDGAFLRVVNFPPRGIGARTLEQLQDDGARPGHVAVAGGGLRRAVRQGRRGARRHSSG